MSNHSKDTPQPLTIVGGRPMHRAVSTADLPIGLEQALTVAGMNYTFREALAKDPVVAAAGVGIQLDEAEVMLLRSAGPERVAQMAARMMPPMDGTRRKFIKNVAASVAAMVTGEAFLLCSGCTGADTWTKYDQGPPKPDKGAPLPNPVQKIATLGGHLCYIYVPGRVLAKPQTPAPLLVALHDATEVCMANITRWGAAADARGFSIVSVNWTEEPKQQKDLDKLSSDLSEITNAFAQLYPVDPKRRCLSSRGASTPIVYKGGFLEDSGFWAAAVFLGGVPMTKCEYGLNKLPPAGLVAKPPALRYVMGKADADYYPMNECLNMFNFYKLECSGQWEEGSLKSAVLSFTAIWDWMSKYTAGA